MKKPLVYIVEDDEVYLKVIKHKLEEHGLNNLQTYRTGEDCLADIEKYPDYLILDFSLEGLNGLDVLNEVKAQSKSTKVIILTVIEDKELAQKCIDAGAEIYIVKNEEGLRKLDKIARDISDANKGFLSGLFSPKNNIFLFLLLIPLVAWAAATTITNNGNWSNSSLWNGGNIADNINEDVKWDSNIGEVIIQNGESYIISDMDMKNGNTLTIDSGGSLILGSSSDDHNLSTGNTAIINVNGDLEIWGKLDVGNKLTLNVTGNLIIHGDVDMGNIGTLDIQGDVIVDGDFTGGNSTNVNVDGTLDIGGDIDVGNGSILTGSGVVTSGGTCTGDPDFCNGAPLPIVLAFFDGSQQGNSIVLNWTTTSEENFDYFSIQKSHDGINFESIAKVKGQVFSSGSILYVFEDLKPFDGVNYYRLKAVDLDGTFELFDVIGVDFSPEDNSFVIYPNPVTNYRFTIDNMSQGNNQTVSLRDISGNSIIQSTLNSGKNEFYLGQDLSPGNYFIIISDNGKKDVRKLSIK